jgi:23S rRNA pseudouridine1911/1915/1917 synthase
VRDSVPASPTPATETERYAWTAATEDAGSRLDRFLTAQLEELSRTRVQELISEGRALVNGVAAKRAQRIESGDVISVEIPAAASSELRPEAIPLDVLYEDADLAVINKPAGMIVHPGAGVAEGTLASALLHRYGSLSSIGGNLRPGIVHRLDRDTSGALVIARNDWTHQFLVKQFSQREVGKTYLALVHRAMAEDSGRIELAVARDSSRRQRMTTRRWEGRAARTDWRVILRLEGFTLVEAGLHTGRTHQIRVHFSALGHPVVGDALYGAPKEVRAGHKLFEPLGRNFLHAARLQFTHPRSGDALDVRAPLAPGLVQFLRKLAAAVDAESAAVDAALRMYL